MLGPKPSALPLGHASMPNIVPITENYSRLIRLKSTLYLISPNQSQLRLEEVVLAGLGFS